MLAALLGATVAAAADHSAATCGSSSFPAAEPNKMWCDFRHSFRAVSVCV